MRTSLTVRKLDLIDRERGGIPVGPLVALTRAVFFPLFLACPSYLSPSLGPAGVRPLLELVYFLSLSLSLSSPNPHKNCPTRSLNSTGIFTRGWLVTGCFYGVVSYKASHALLLYPDILCVRIWILITPDLSTSAHWLQQRLLVAKQLVDEKCPWN
jgi:hypothetical protein